MSPPASAGADACKLQEFGGECRATPQHTEKSQEGHSNLGHHPFTYLRHVDVANGMILRSNGFQVGRLRSVSYVSVTSADLLITK